MEKQPFVCPVCSGKGKVESDFYGNQTTNASEVTCRTCKGEGIVWREKVNISSNKGILNT